MTELDHIAVAAPDLGRGAAWVREMLGVEMPAGGKYPEMGGVCVLN
jgi:glyoxalase-like protein